MPCSLKNDAVGSEESKIRLNGKTNYCMKSNKGLIFYRSLGIIKLPVIYVESILLRGNENGRINVKRKA